MDVSKEWDELFGRSKGKGKGKGKRKGKGQEQQKPIPISVIQAKRLHAGTITVIGTIVSVSDMYVLEIIDAQKVVKEYRNAKSIQLEDTETLDSNEQLDVVLYDHMINNVVAGETVQISGNMSIEDRRSNDKSKKKYNVLHATSILYLNRKELVITKEDIKSFQRFVSYSDPYLTKRLVVMFAPNIIGHEDVKRGLLRSIVGGVDRGKMGGGRVDTLMVGDPGTAKSKLGSEATEIKPNSRHVSAPHATTKTITAIVEKINESISLVLGAIPLSKGAICSIDEINSFSIEDQSRLLDVLEGGIINIDKLGKRYVVPAATTVIATLNPIGGKWNSPQIATKEEIELKRSLMDRFTQIYVFRDDMETEQTESFVLQMSKIRKRRPHNYNFLRKYLICASNIKNVKITDEAEAILNKFWSESKVKNLLSIRMWGGLYKIAEAQAKLLLRDTVDADIAQDVIEDLRLIMVEYGETVGKILGPHEVAYSTCLEVLRDSEVGMTVGEMCQLAIQKNDQIASYLGYIFRTDQNHKLRNVVKSLLNNPNIKKVGENPKVLQFLHDRHDLHDVENKNKIDDYKNSNLENLNYENN